MIALSLPLFVVAAFWHRFWPVPVALFVVGWVFQFAGHYVEGTPPEFFHDWRFLFVGLPLRLVTAYGSPVRAAAVLDD